MSKSEWDYRCYVPLPSPPLTDCSMWLKDDNVYEGVEGLYLELDRTSRDPAVRLIPDRQRAIIYIHDVDDGM